ncbi:MAG: S8 family serine peptidase [Prevotella sp.]|nr:S8 family serine peptidase [Prevotella sp.]
MKKLLLLIAFLAGTFLVSYAQKATKISPSTRIVIADRDGKLSLDAAKKEMTQMKKNKRNAPWKAPSATETTAEDDDEGDGFPFATPSTVNGVKMVQCWISMTNDNYAALEALGVKIQAKFDGKVTANVPVNAIEEVAALGNVIKVSVAKKLKKKTYRSRVMTNVDDVLNYSSDAQAAGLLQAYNGTGVVLGIIDTGIDFGHQMFSGRIKKKYVYNTTAEELQEYTGSTVYYTDETHGTHTSSIAGGSDYTATAYVYTTSTSYTTVNNAKFGGMAPGTDLVLCDLGEELTDANIAACIKNISDYADQVGKPCVISLSLGSHYGPHDGTGNMADVCAQYTGKGKIILYASGNEGEDGIYLGKNASSSSPAMTVLTSETRSSYNVDYGAMISYARTPNVELAVRYYVVNTSSNTVLWTSNEITTDDYFVDDEGNIELYGAEISVNDTGSDGSTPLSTYFTAYNNDSDNYGYLCGYMEKDSHNDKWNVETILYYLKAVSNNYKIGISVYPKNGTCYVDSWPITYIDFTASSATVNGNRFTAGSNESSASDEASYPSVISVGSYVSSKYWRAGTTSGSNQYWTNNGTYEQISMFSSYQPEGSGPTGLKQPWITAPGEVILAAYNSGYSASNYYYAYGTNKVLGAMSGTSMATPCAAGITALWLQAKPTMTPAEVKEVMAETAIKDSYVTGTYASHFGQGKIDALAGIKYILENDDEPRIVANPTSVELTAKPNETATIAVNVKGRNLTGNITATLNDANGLFAIDQTTIANSAAANGVDITITYSPTAEGSHTATITLASEGADNVTVTINGTCQDGGTASDAYLDIAKYATIDEAGWRTQLVNNLYKYTEYASQKVAWLTIPVYGAFVGARYATNSNTVGSGHPQNWIECNLGTSNTYGGTTWTYNATYTNPYNGSSAYFTSATARAIGYNSRTNTDIRTVSFYVTNTTEVKLYGTGRNGTSSTYPARLRIYECTENADGTLTVGTTAVVNQTSSSTSTFNLSSGTLDASKIYKVETSIYRGYLYEIGFQTPLKSAEIIATPTSLSFETPVGVPVEKTFNVKGNELEGNITATLTTNQGNVYSIDASNITVAEAESGSGKDVTVTFSPTAAGTYTGTITLTSDEADAVTVNLNGRALAPSIIADPETLNFTTEVNTPVSLTFDVTAENLSDAITVTLTDENGVYTIDTESISIAESEDGKTVTVTFSPTEFGTFTGTVTLSAPYAEDVIVTLNGIASEYFDVKISDVGLTTLYLDYPVQIPYDEYDPDILGVFYIYNIVGSELKAARLYETIPANTGVIIQGNSNTAECPAYRFPRVAEADPLTRSSYLSGSVVNTTVAAVLAETPGTIYTLGRGSDTYINFYRYSGKNLAANKAFLILGGNNAKGFSLVVDGEEATGIKALDTVTDDGAWYTVEGIKLQGKPTRKGVYLHNGKSVIMK